MLPCLLLHKVAHVARQALRSETLAAVDGASEVSKHGPTLQSCVVEAMWWPSR